MTTRSLAALLSCALVAGACTHRGPSGTRGTSASAADRYGSVVVGAQDPCSSASFWGSRAPIRAWGSRPCTACSSPSTTWTGCSTASPARSWTTPSTSRSRTTDAAPMAPARGRGARVRSAGRGRGGDELRDLVGGRGGSDPVRQGRAVDLTGEHRAEPHGPGNPPAVLPARGLQRGARCGGHGGLRARHRERSDGRRSPRRGCRLVGAHRCIHGSVRGQGRDRHHVAHRRRPGRRDRAGAGRPGQDAAGLHVRARIGPVLWGRRPSGPGCVQP